MAGTFGTGVFGSNVITFDGGTINPVDSFSIRCTYKPSFPITVRQTRIARALRVTNVSKTGTYVSDIARSGSV